MKYLFYNKLLLYFAYIFFLLILILYRFEIVDSFQVFIILSCILILTVSLQLFHLNIYHPQIIFINPFFFGSFFTFIIFYGFSNFIFLLNTEQLDTLGLNIDVTNSMIKHLVLILISSIAMWLGYWSIISNYLSKDKFHLRFKKKFLSTSQKFKFSIIFIFIIISFCSRFLQIKLGVYGYSGNLDSFDEFAWALEYLTLLSELSKLSLVLLALRFFKGDKSLKIKFFLISLFFIEIIFGFLSGFKFQTIAPIIILGICQYIITGNISKYWIIPLIVIFGLAFFIIEPFRIAKDLNPNFDSTSFTEIIQTISSGYNTVEIESQNERFATLYYLAKRTNLTYIGSFGIEYADNNMLNKDSPKFLKNILLSPIHAWIPRFIWESKPLGNLGLWYNQEVMGINTFSSTGMGAVTYLYFSGGYLMVFIGFFIWGILQRIIFFLLRPWLYISSSLVYLSIFSVLSIPNSSFNGSLVSVFRILPIALFVVLIILPQKKEN